MKFIKQAKKQETLIILYYHLIPAKCSIYIKSMD